MKHKWLGFIAAVVVLASVACSAVPNIANQAGKASVAGAPPAAQPAAPPAAMGSQAAAREAPDSARSTASIEPSAAQAQTFDRMVIRNAQLALEVSEIESALAQVRQIAQQGGGIVTASNTRVERVDDQERMVADLTIQVRSDAADSALSALRALGKVTSETSSSQDVTEEYVDLDSNLRNLQASEAAILRLMERAQRIEDIVSLQRELTTIRGQIERIQGRKRYLERRSDMATITLALRLPPVEGARPLTGGGWNPLTFALRGWQASLSVLRGIAEVVILVVSFSWWLLPLAVLAVYVWQQRRRPRPAAAAPPAADA